MNDTDQAIDTPKEAPRGKPPEEIAETLRLRPDRPKVARVSRKVLIGGSALVLVLITGAVLWALQEKRSGTSAPEELYATDHHKVADQLATLPKDYTEIPKDVPRLGPPLLISVGRSSQHRDLRRPARSVSMPNSSVSTRRARRHGPARYLPAPISGRKPLPLHRAKPVQAPRHHPTKHLLRMAKTESSRSSVQRSIVGRQAPIAL